MKSGIQAWQVIKVHIQNLPRTNRENAPALISLLDRPVGTCKEFAEVKKELVLYINLPEHTAYEWMIARLMVRIRQPGQDYPDALKTTFS